jgi:hypothetical protein
MSTRSIIARATGEGTFKGVYHHWDGYPTGLGKNLTEILVSPFANDLPRMLHALIDEHPAGWSTIVHKDFTLAPGYTWENVKHPSCEGKSDAEYHAAMETYRTMPDMRRPQCYCHGERCEEAQTLTECDDANTEWAYVFDEDERVMHVRHRTKHRRQASTFGTMSGESSSTTRVRRTGRTSNAAKITSVAHTMHGSIFPNCRERPSNASARRNFCAANRCNGTTPSPTFSTVFVTRARDAGSAADMPDAPIFQQLFAASFRTHNIGLKR